jgi:hypothetical protein
MCFAEDVFSVIPEVDVYTKSERPGRYESAIVLSEVNLRFAKIWFRNNPVATAPGSDFV